MSRAASFGELRAAIGGSGQGADGRRAKGELGQWGNGWANGIGDEMAMSEGGGICQARARGGLRSERTACSKAECSPSLSFLQSSPTNSRPRSSINQHHVRDRRDPAEEDRGNASGDLRCEVRELKGLFMGSVGAALNRFALKSLGITHVLIVAKSLDPAFPNDFIYKKIEVLDTEETNLSEHFDECFDFINEAKQSGGGVLVHCFAGRSRSGTIVVAYLMKQHRMSRSQALELVRSKRPQVQPNLGFVLQLINFEKSLGVLQDNSG
ncbi:dual specificity protein phosphatase 1B-like [Asparagus officinalis]|uniref:dual specificity protein phosphatase 1B-like n=1 Tax=Asparagus officinalis TaxID=4686 RepID=UPI00098DFA77|nr:dual specificity protein phosphatase 1B-like [Asparagus officinalis]